MKYFIRRDTSSADARFEISDGLGAVCYRAHGRRSPSGETIRICADGETVARVRDLDLSVLSTFGITTPTESAQLIVTPKRSGLSVRFHGISFHIRGDILSGSYDILDADNTVVAAITKHFSKGCTELNAFNSRRELFCLATLICIESIAISATPAMQTV